MGYAATHWIMNNTDLQGTELAVATMLAVVCSDTTGATIRSKKTLVDMLHMSERQLKYVISALSAKGVLIVGKRFADNGHQLSNGYIIAGYMQSLGLTPAAALKGLEAELLELKQRPEREGDSYDYSRNSKDSKNNPLVMFDMGDEDLGGGAIWCPQGGQSGAPQCLTLFSSNTTTSPANAVDVVPAPETADAETEQLPFTDLPDSVAEQEPVHVPAKTSKRKVKSKAVPSEQELALRSATHAILSAYVEVLGYEPASFGREGSAAKQLAKQGWTPEQVVKCYRSLKSDRFWSDKHLSLTVVHTNIAARMGTVSTNSKGNTNGNLNNPNTIGRVQLSRDVSHSDAFGENFGVSDDELWDQYLASRQPA